MKSRIPTLDEFVNEATWHNEKYGFKISKFLEQYSDKKLTGLHKIEIITNDFFRGSTVSYVKKPFVNIKNRRFHKVI